MDFAHPDHLWLTIAAPAALVLAALGWRRRLAATAAWAARSLWDRLLTGHSRRRLWLWSVLLAVAVAAVAVTLARPRWGSSEQEVERRGVDVAFVLDTSLSMATRDVPPSRLWVAQTLVRRLVEAMPGNRVSLVQAEGDGVVMTPLTADAAVVDLLLDAVLPGSLPTPGTELAPALEKAIELFPEGSSKHKVVVLLSDGEDHGGALDRVAEKLEESGAVLHAVGVGTLEGKPLELPRHEADGDGGAPLEYKRDQEGNVVVSRLVESTLEELARDTGGVYLRATSPAADLGRILEEIEGMEKHRYGSEVVSTLEERFQWPLALAIAALVLQALVPPFRSPRSGEEGR